MASPPPCRCAPPVRAPASAWSSSGEHRILSTGYNGAPPGEDHCLDVGCRIEDGRRGCTSARGPCYHATMSGEHGDPARLRELMLYVVAAYRQRLSFNVHELAKVLYLCDFAAYDRLGRSITGSSYVKHRRGPRPAGFDEALDALVEAGRVAVGIGSDVVPATDADVRLFTASELGLVDEVIGRLSTSAGSDWSYGAGWNAVGYGEEIPYCFAGVSDDELNDTDLERAREIAAHGIHSA